MRIFANFGRSGLYRLFDRTLFVRCFIECTRPTICGPEISEVSISVILMMAMNLIY